MDSLIRHFQDAVAQGAPGQRGLAGMLLLTDRLSDRAVAILLWESESDLLAHSNSHSQRLLPATDLLVAPEHASYEVSVQVERTAQGTLLMHGI
jgi:hypothetical protein